MPKERDARPGRGAPPPPHGKRGVARHHRCRHEGRREGPALRRRGETGRIFVHDAETGELVRALDTPESESTYINDVALSPGGEYAYFTDSVRPVVFRVPVTPDGVGEAEPWLDLEETPMPYIEGINLDGIATTADGRYLVVIHSVLGELFRIDTESGETIQIDIGGKILNGSDGLVLDGQTLYLVQNRGNRIYPIELSDDFASGEVGEPFASESFFFPTAIAQYDGGERLLVANSQPRLTGSDQEKGPEQLFSVFGIEIP